MKQILKGCALLSIALAVIYYTYGGFWDSIGDSFKSAGNAIKNTAESAGNAIKNAAETVGEKTKGAAETAVNKTAEAGKTVGGAVASTAKTAVRQIKRTTRQVGRAVTGTARTAGGAIKGAAQTAVHKTAEAGKTAGGAVASTAKTAGGAIKGAGETAIAGIKTAAEKTKEGAELVVKITKEFGETAVRVAPDLINIATSGGSCPDANVSCFAGYGKDESLCGTLKQGSNFNIAAGCVANPAEVLNSCNKLCKAQYEVDSSRFEIHSGKSALDGFKEFFTEAVANGKLFMGGTCKQKATVDCHAGFGKGEVSCGKATVGTTYRGVSKGCIPNVNEEGPVCAALCGKMGLEAAP